MIPFVFRFPQDPMPGFEGAFSGITHGKCFAINATSRGAEVHFHVGSLSAEDPATPDATLLDRFQLHRAIDTQQRLALWDDIIALGGVVDATNRILSLNAVIKAAWDLYREEEGLPPDPVTA